MACAIVALTVFCSVFYHINAILMFAFVLLSIAFALIAVRVVAESGLNTLRL